MSEYTVGYGKPPQATRFQKGKSGNPRGRGKGTQNLKTILEEELQGTVTITEGGKKAKVSKLRAMLKSLMARSMSGDIRATTVLFGLVLKVVDPDAQPLSSTDIPLDDIKIVDRFLNRHRGEQTKESNHE